MGYVGLPLALAFSKKKSVIGFDKEKERISELKRGIDRNNELKKELNIKIEILNLPITANY